MNMQLTFVNNKIQHSLQWIVPLNSSIKTNKTSACILTEATDV